MASRRRAVIAEPGHSRAEDSDRSRGSLVGAGLGIGDAGLVIVLWHEFGPHHRAVGRVPLTGSGRGGVALARPSCRPRKDGRRRRGSARGCWRQRGSTLKRVLVAADRLTGYRVDANEPVEPAVHQNSMTVEGARPSLAADLHRTKPSSPTQRDDPPASLPHWCDAGTNVIDASGQRSLRIHTEPRRRIS